MEIFKIFTVEAAHHLPNVPKITNVASCTAIPSGSRRVTGPVQEQAGWVMDRRHPAFQPVYEQLDHRYLNETSLRSTSERLARDWRKLKPALPRLSEIVVRETCTAGCIYRGED